MKIVTLNVGGIHEAIHGMPNPYSSWDMSDSDEKSIGKKDKTLSQALSDRGPEHDKHLRLIVCWAEISAPRYWWTEFDTYRHGVEKISESTMHTIMRKPFTVNDFEGGHAIWYMEKLVEHLNVYREHYLTGAKTEEDKRLWWEHVIKLLPQSYVQKRTVMMSYKAIQTMYKQREGHKLGEWAYFRSWAETLPESWMIKE